MKDLLDLISQSTDPTPLGTVVFSFAGPEQFPEEDWIDIQKGIAVFPKEKYPELAEAMPSWISGGGVTDCNP